MSFGKKKMRAVADALAPAVLVCDFRGMEWMVITANSIHYGKTNVEEENLFHATAPSVALVSEAYRPWAKRLMSTVKVTANEQN